MNNAGTDAGEGAGTRAALVVAAVPIFIELHLGAHLELLDELGYSVTMVSSDRPDFDYNFREVPFSRRSFSVAHHFRSVRTLRKLLQHEAEQGPVLMHIHTPLSLIHI